MAYAARDDRPADKAARYAEVEAEILAVLDGEPNRTARMARKNLLVVKPRIPPGRRWPYPYF